MNDKLTAIYAIIDGSGSMASLQDSVISSLNEFVDTHKRINNSTAVMSLSQFSSDYSGNLDFRTIRHFTNVKDMPKLNRQSYDPRGGTPLLAAVTKAIDEFGEDLAAMPEAHRPSQVMFVVMTDGYENTSDRLKFTKAALKAKIKHQEEKYNWRFIFLGANQDAFAEAGGLGFQQHATANYQATPQGVKEAMYNVAYASASYRGGMNSAGALPTNQMSVREINSLIADINKEKEEVSK